ncbi:hypothetical protein LCGC14_0538030 [marine sediment metagenome]|uniref:Uncharacterized protein n=1 Tax=marine sediment metagenome TaxID=412755 RepID=A0A0F9RTN9_9ZZZZ
MKLKTLKDIPLNLTGHEDVRKEAIKWVKEWEKNDEIDDGLGNTEYSFETASLIFKHFFNITEEDLK